MTPITNQDKDKVYLEFFRPEFVSQRLGKPGRWQGGAVPRLMLQNPVKKKAFETVLLGRSLYGEPLVDLLQRPDDRINAWHHSLAARPTGSMIWALSPDPIRARIRLSHHRAVAAAVTDFERTLNGASFFDDRTKPGWKMTLFAAFHSAASPECTPRLETNLFLFNFTLIRGVGIGSLSPEQVQKLGDRLDSVYRATLKNEVLWLFGGARLDVPKELAIRVEEEIGILLMKNHGRAESKPLKGAALSTTWRKVADHLGWGPRKIQRMLWETKSQPTLRNWARDWKTILRIGSIVAKVNTKPITKLAKTFIEKHLPESQSEQLARKPEQERGTSQSY